MCPGLGWLNRLKAPRLPYLEKNICVLIVDSIFYVCSEVGCLL